MGIKYENWKRVSFSLRVEVIEKLDSISRNSLPNKSKLIEKLIVDWLYKNNYISSGSL